MQEQKKRRLNNKDLTIEKLREFKGFESVTEEEAELIIDTTKELCFLMYNAFQNSIKTEIKDAKRSNKPSKIS